ncbi:MULTISPECIES: methionyl-tRNA formyltransferase [Parachlamydia]|jgi:methionyl-tRNA formyltransferase|uniref:Methionyl-tRNA formyltransferase n=2 Tax=Parachlamydia acanthamoebae TaxID=83552 RepID=F8L1U1_PARAV|nr:methionyl-tRNA formyltransferase [Parachlamydia acanthamoebae]CCB87255.1 methionyl-tRNA formyltransferase [Parachlamydia acanthamoebae UV-7]
MKVVFFGTPQFAANVLSDLLNSHIDVVAVITKPDRAQGRSKQLVPTPVKQVALMQATPIPCFQPELVSAPEFADTLAAFKPDLFVVVAYGEIIKQHLLDMPKMGCINLHASLLPKYRGAAPIQRAIMNGESEIGVTIMHMVKKMDAGDMIKKASIVVDENQSFPEIEQALCRIGSHALLEVLREIEAGASMRQPQNHDEVTYAPKIELEDCYIDWNRSASDLHHLVRAVTPEPGAWCYVEVKQQKKRLRILKSQMMTSGSGQPGEILGYGKEGLIVACGEGSLRIVTLQLEGKNAMSAEDLMRGIPRQMFSFVMGA